MAGNKRTASYNALTTKEKRARTLQERKDQEDGHHRLLMEEGRVTRAAKARALANPAWASEIPHVTKPKPAKRNVKRKKQEPNDSFPEDGIPDLENDQDSVPTHQPKRIKKAVNPDDEGEDAEMEVNQVDPQPPTSNPNHRDPSPSTTELQAATPVDTAAKQKPTAATSNSDKMQSTKARTGIPVPRPTLPRNRSPSPPPQSQPAPPSKSHSQRPPQSRSQSQHPPSGVQPTTATASSSRALTRAPSRAPSRAPTRAPSRAPSHAPSRAPSHVPTRHSSRALSVAPPLLSSRALSPAPVNPPSRARSRQPPRHPSQQPPALHLQVPSNDPPNARSSSRSRSRSSSVISPSSPRFRPSHYERWAKSVVKSGKYRVSASGLEPYDPNDPFYQSIDKSREPIEPIDNSLEPIDGSPEPIEPIDGSLEPLDEFLEPVKPIDPVKKTSNNVIDNDAGGIDNDVDGDIDNYVDGDIDNDVDDLNANKHRAKKVTKARVKANTKGDESHTTDGSESDPNAKASEGETSDDDTPLVESLLRERPVLSTPPCSDYEDPPSARPNVEAKKAASKAKKAADTKGKAKAKAVDDEAEAQAADTRAEGKTKAVDTTAKEKSKAVDTTRSKAANTTGKGKSKAADTMGKGKSKAADTTGKGKSKAVDANGVEFPAVLQWDSSDDGEREEQEPVKSKARNGPHKPKAAPKVGKRLKKRQDERVNLTSDEEVQADNVEGGNGADNGKGDKGDKDTIELDDNGRIKWPEDTCIYRSDSKHVTVGVQTPRIQVVFEKALALTDRIFYFTNPYLEYPNKLIAFRRILIDAANHESIGDSVLASRWKQDTKQMMLAKNIPESRFCNRRTEVKRVMRGIVPSAYKLGTGEECVRRVARWLDSRRYIFGLTRTNGSDHIDFNLPFQHPAIAQGLAACFFDGNTSPVSVELEAEDSLIDHGSSGEVLCPPTMVCLVATAIEHCLLEWQSGARQGRDFTVNSSWATYTAHLNTLRRINNDPEPSNHGVEACNYILSTLYEQASFGQLYTAAIDKVVEENMERINVGKMPTRKQS